MSRPSFTRVLLKLSGESLAGDQGYGIDPQTIGAIAVRFVKSSIRVSNWLW